MISKAIYLYTLKRMAKHYVFYVIAFGFVLVLPLTTLADTNAANAHNDALSSYTCSLLFGLSIIVSQNIAGGGAAQGGGSDYLPLILSRPISRAQYIFSKWIALSSAVGLISVLQFLMLCLIGETVTHHWTVLMVLCAFLERLLDALSVSIALVLVSLLPTRQLFGYGVIALEMIGLNHLVFDFDFYVPSYSSSTIGVLKQLGIYDWSNRHFLPLLTTCSPQALFAGLNTLIAQVSDVIAPRFFVFDFLTNSTFDIYPLVTYLMNLCVGLVLCNILLNWRDINYASE
jgi:ABC-type transport system involved in multi-copper enzyme maturation permease subunit